MVRGLVFVIISLCSLLNSTLIEIHNDGTGDYPTIQEGIDAATTGDTIHVRPGTYYENLYIDNDLSLVSNYEFTGNETDLHNTILDGSLFSLSVIKVDGEETNYIVVYICGFTIQNGSLRDERGGGIYSRYASLTLKKNIIQDNNAYRGGGISFRDTSANLIGNTIRNNHAPNLGGGFFIMDSSIDFDPQILNNVYLNYAGCGADIYKFNSEVEVIVDTFSVSNPDFFFLYAMEDQYYDEEGIPYNIQNAKIEQIEQDLYVSASGDDNNSGISPEESLQNIHYALTLIEADSQNPRTIYVEDGLYSESLNNQYFPLHMKSYVSLIGESMNYTILDSESGQIYANDILEAGNGFLQRDWSVMNFKMINTFDIASCTIQLNHNVYFENIEISDGAFAALIRIYLTKIDMNNIYIHDCVDSAALWFYGSNGYDVNFTNFKVHNLSCDGNVGFTIKKNPSSQPDHTVNIINAEFHNNSAYLTDWPNVSSAIKATEFSKVNLINSTITQNESNTGGAVLVSYESEMNIYNSILYGDDPREIVLDGSGGHVNNLNIYNSLIQGGEAGVQSTGTKNFYWDSETNLDTDPLFIGEGDYPFAFSELSPCKDTGTIDLPEGVILPEYDLAGNLRIYGDAIDMGAYEWYPVSADNEEIPNSSSQFSNLTNYPNPFNPETTITFNVPQTFLFATIEIYNLKGQKVKQFSILEGQTSVVWNAEKFASGVYLYKSNVPDSPIKKMMLIK